MSLFGLSIQNTTLELAAKRTLQSASSRQGRRVYFVNAHCVNIAASEADYEHILHDADLLYADGIGMRLAARVAGVALRGNVNGTDLFPLLCAGAARAGLELAFIEQAGHRTGLCAQHDGRIPAKVTYIQDGYFSAAETSDVLQAVRHSQARLVFVAMGVPRQEQFIHAHRLIWAPRSASGSVRCLTFTRAPFPGRRG